MTERIEHFIQHLDPSGDPTEIPAVCFAADVVELHTSRTDSDGEFAPQAPTVELMDLTTWRGQWALYHQMLGGMVAMRTGAPCPLADQASTEGGLAAADAAYKLISQNPVLSRMILDPRSSFWGQIMIVGAHGMACVGIMKASALGATLTESAQDEVAA